MKRFTLFLLLVLPFITKATGYISVVAGGLWSSAATWSPAGHPGSGDDVTIATNVTEDGSASVHNLTVNIGQTLTMNNGDVLNVYGNFTNNGSLITNTSTIIFSGSANQTVTNTSAFWFLTINQTASTDTVFLLTPITINSTFNLTTGVLACQTNQITGNSSRNFNMGAGGTLVLGLKSSSTNVAFPTNFTSGLCVFNAGSSVVYQANTASQVISNIPTYSNLSVFSGSSSVTKNLSVAGTINVAGNLTVGDATSAGTVTFGLGTNTLNLTGSATTATINTNGALTFSTGTCTITNGLLINGNGSFAFSGSGALNIGGNFTNNGSSPSTSFTASTSTVTFHGSAYQSLGGTQSTTFSTLYINAGSADTVKLGDSVSTNTFKLQNGYFDQSKAGNYPLTVTSAFTNIATTAKYICEKGSVYFGNGGGSVTLNGSSVASIFYNVVCNPGLGNSVTASGVNMTVNNNLSISTGNLIVNTKTVTVGNNVTITNGATLTYTTGILNVGGNFTENGTFTYGTGTVDFDGTGSIIQTISGTAAQPLNFYNLTIAATAPDTIRLGDSIKVNDIFTFSSGTSGVFDVSKNDYEVICSSNAFTNNESTSAFYGRKGWVIFNGEFFLNGTASTVFNDLKIEGTAVTVSKSETVSDTLELISGNISMASPYIMTIGNSFLNYKAGGFSSGTGLFQFTGNTNKLNYIGGTQPINLYNLTVNLAYATDTLFLDNEGITENNADSINQGVFHCQNFTLTGGGNRMIMKR